MNGQKPVRKTRGSSLSRNSSCTAKCWAFARALRAGGRTCCFSVAVVWAGDVLQHERREPDDRLVVGNVGGMSRDRTDFLALFNFLFGRLVRLDQEIACLLVKPDRRRLVSGRVGADTENLQGHGCFCRRELHQRARTSSSRPISRRAQARRMEARAHPPPFVLKCSFSVRVARGASSELRFAMITERSAVSPLRDHGAFGVRPVGPATARETAPHIPCCGDPADHHVRQVHGDRT
ncbi:hypothetical protein SAMN04487983_106429 [Streptomyces sp. yr375]|nr:hypothetical protein SAMN04487983_106429 [Streptomyces sp. yr375]